MDEACVVCGRVFRKPSRPRRLFDRRTLAYLGLAHSTCSQRGCEEFSTDGPTWAQQCYLWARQIRDAEPELWTEQHQRALHLMLSGRAEHDRLSERQRELLSWWQQGPMHLSEQEAAATVEAYWSLYRRWLEAGLPALTDVA